MSIYMNPIDDTERSGRKQAHAQDQGYKRQWTSVIVKEKKVKTKRDSTSHPLE